MGGARARESGWQEGVWYAAQRSRIAGAAAHWLPMSTPCPPFCQGSIFFNSRAHRSPNDTSAGRYSSCRQGQAGGQPGVGGAVRVPGGRRWSSPAYLDRLGVTCPSAAHLFVGGCLRVALSIAGGSGHHARYVLEGQLHAPEAPAREGRKAGVGESGSGVGRRPDAGLQRGR